MYGSLRYLQDMRRRSIFAETDQRRPGRTAQPHSKAQRSLPTPGDAEYRSQTDGVVVGQTAQKPSLPEPLAQPVAAAMPAL